MMMELSNRQSAVSEVLELAREISHESVPGKRDHSTEQFLNKLNSLNSEQLTEVIAKLASYDTNPGAVSKALREGAIVAAETRNAALIMQATKKLDANTFRLTVMLIILAIVGLLVAFIPDSKKGLLDSAILGLLRNW